MNSRLFTTNEYIREDFFVYNTNGRCNKFINVFNCKIKLKIADYKAHLNI